jgi:uncharacterized protein
MATLSPEELDSLLAEADALSKRKSYQKSRELFETLFEQIPLHVAVHLGFLYSRRDNSEYDRDKAIYYYKIAAEDKNVYAQFALGLLLIESGNEDEAVKWFCEGSKLGHDVCSYLAYDLLSKRGSQAAEEFFSKAIEQGNPLAIKLRSAQKMKGSFGVTAILPGFIDYIKNVPRLARYLRKYHYTDGFEG